MDRVFNFSAGPSCLPLEVLQQAQTDLINYKGCGMSVMEMSHRSRDFEEIIQTAESDLRDLMNIPDNYKVLFLQGGGTLQFSMVPSSPDNGRKRLQKKRRSSAISASRPHLSRMYIPTFRSSAERISAKMRIMSTSRQTIRFTAAATTTSLIQEMSFWQPISHPTSCRKYIM